ncbi:chromate transporter [Candidatus Microgenomates bacterium]|nr:chromate transporter [Candidatus Microgenomates bacterium]
MATSNKDLNASLGSLEKTLKVYFVDKAPFQIPTGGKEFIVQYGPWITLVLLILALPVIFAALGLTAFLSPFAAMGGQRASINFLSIILSVIALILEAMALPGLFRRSKSGWNLLFYSSIVSAIDNLVNFHLGGLIIGLLIGWYILFQVRSYYK